MSKPLTIVARIKAKPGQEDALAAELAKLVAPTLLEVGCLQYDFHRDLENPGIRFGRAYLFRDHNV